MKKIRIIMALAVLAAAFVSCSGDDDGGAGSSEASALKGTPGAIGNGTSGIFTGGSAFMYRTRLVHHFLLCEGEAKNWNDALKRPHLEIGINDNAILDDILSITDMSKAIDINDPRFANAECPVSVRWNRGDGVRFQGKYGYQGGANNYVFQEGKLFVAKGPMKGMFTIAFVGYGKDGGNNRWDTNWSYGGQFSR